MKHSTSSYAPDDAKISVQSLEFLHAPPHSAPGTGAELLAAVLAAVRGSGELTVSQIAGLRKKYSAEHVHAALTLARVQAKGAVKFPDLPFVWATPEALEQASSMAVARRKAARFAEVRPGVIVDLCCGIGGDTLALAEVAPVIAVDMSAVRTTCLRFNAEGRGDVPMDIRTADVRDVLATLPREAVFHIDPARRSGGKRSAEYADLIPGPDVLDAVQKHFAGGAMKLSPAVDFESLPAGHLMLIGEAGSVVQAVLWTGVLAETFLAGTRTVWSDRGDFAGVPARAVVVPGVLAGDLKGRILCELEGTLTRAGLAQAFAGEHGLMPLTYDGGYALVREGSRPVSGLVTFFVIGQVVPFSEKRLADALAALPGEPSAVEVKSRGRLPGVETDDLQRRWAKAGRGRPTVLLFEYGGDVVAVIARRAADVRSLVY